MIACEICGKGPALEHGGVTVHRQNELGVDGIWRCLEHNTLPIDEETQEIIAVVKLLEEVKEGGR